MSLKYQDVRKEFSNYKKITIDDLVNYYRVADPNVKKTTINWRIYELVQNGALQRTGRGKYIVGKQLKYAPELTTKEIKISKLIKNEFPFINHCLWSVSYLNEFLQHQTVFSFLIVEVEKEAIEAVYFKLKESVNLTFKKPTKEILEEFIGTQQNSIVINAFVSEAPIQKINNIPTPSLEKVLVDLFCDNKLFYFLQGNELVNIYKNAFEKYTINQSKLLRYADRRRKKTEISNFINSIIRH